MVGESFSGAFDLRLPVAERSVAVVGRGTSKEDGAVVSFFPTTGGCFDSPPKTCCVWPSWCTFSDMTLKGFGGAYQHWNCGPAWCE